MNSSLLDRRKTHFLLWRVGDTSIPPQLIVGQFQAGNPPSLSTEQRFNLTPSTDFPRDIWEIAATDCNLHDGQVYYYWFEVQDTDPGKSPSSRIQCTDPFAHTVDYRLRSPSLPSPYEDKDRRPASVIKYLGGQLIPCDPGGEVGIFSGDPNLNTLPSNNRLVIYELPTAWTRSENDLLERGVGTFRDVAALIDPQSTGANFADLEILEAGRSYLTELGVNALELLPPADSRYEREWGYGTSNFFAPDYELGFPIDHSSPTAAKDLTALVLACHQQGIRFFVDMVLAFIQQGPYQCINFPDFHINIPPDKEEKSRAELPNELKDDPDALKSGRGDGSMQVSRKGFGSKLIRYARQIDSAYDPILGTLGTISPGRQFMLAYVTRWMRDFRIDGIRLDSIENIANWDFIRDFRKLARDIWKDRWQEQNSSSNGADERFLVVGEELSLPLGLIQKDDPGNQRLDGLWNESFKSLIRAALLGETSGSNSFEETVKKAIDCRRIGFKDLSEAIIYLTSHDVEGFRNERLYNFFVKPLNNNEEQIAKRIKLGFACLLTAVGIPMILAGDEFADRHDRFDAAGNVTQDGGKQVDPVNYSRLQDEWRKDIFNYVSRLVKLRTSSNALSVNDVNFIHTDFNNGKKVLVWQRGTGTDLVVVVANFSDYISSGGTDGEYIVPNWPFPQGVAGKSWKEYSQKDPPRLILNKVGREPIFAWEAKVYVLES